MTLCIVIMQNIEMVYIQKLGIKFSTPLTNI